MIEWITLGLFAAAVISAGLAGVLGHHALFRGRVDTDGLKLDTLVAPLATLAVILVSFTLITTYNSYRDAANSTNDEAGTVDQIYEMAGLLRNPELRQHMQGHVICYGRAVVVQEWPLLSKGQRSPTVQKWTAHFEDDLRQALRFEEDSIIVSRLIDVDNERAAARSVRVNRANPTAPFLVFGLLVASAIAAVFALGFLAGPSLPRVVSIPVVLTFTLLIGGALIVVTDLNRPYQGWAKIPPSSISRSVANDERDYSRDYPGSPFPCDEQGSPVG